MSFEDDRDSLTDDVRSSIVYDFSSARAADDGETNVRAAFTPCSDCGVEMNIDGFRSCLWFERCFIVHANAENEVLVKMPAGVAGVCVCVCMFIMLSFSFKIQYVYRIGELSLFVFI